MEHAWDKQREIEDWVEGGRRRIEVEDVDEYVMRVAVVLGIRIGQVTGVAQGVHWERMRHTEETAGVHGRQARVGDRGCLVCRQWRDKKGLGWGAEEEQPPEASMTHVIGGGCAAHTHETKEVMNGIAEAAMQAMEGIRREGMEKEATRVMAQLRRTRAAASSNTGCC